MTTRNHWRLPAYSVLIVAATTAVHAEDPGADAVSLGMLPTMFRTNKTAAAFTALKSPFSAVVEKQTGLGNKLLLLSDVEAMRQRLGDGQLHFGLCHGFEFAWMRLKEPRLKALMIAAPVHRPLKAFVVVAESSQARNIDDLRGRAIALPNGLHETARLFAARQCRCPAGEPTGYYERVTVPVNSETALHDVYDRKLDAAIVDSSGMQCFAERYPARSRRLKVLIETEPFPMTAVVIHEGRVDSDIQRRFQSGMKQAGTTILGRQLIGLMQSSGFEPVPDDYEKQLARVLQLYPPPEADDD